MTARAPLVYVCHSCGLKFKHWTGPNGAQTHANEVHRAARVGMSPSELGVSE